MFKMISKWLIFFKDKFNHFKTLSCETQIVFISQLAYCQLS